MSQTSFFQKILNRESSINEKGLFCLFQTQNFIKEKQILNYYEKMCLCLVGFIIIEASLAYNLMKMKKTQNKKNQRERQPSLKYLKSDNSLTNHLSTSPHSANTDSQLRTNHVKSLVAPSECSHSLIGSNQLKISLNIYQSNYSFLLNKEQSLQKLFTNILEDIGLNQLTKLCLKMILTQRLSEIDSRYLSIFHSSLKEYESQKMERI